MALAAFGDHDRGGRESGERIMAAHEAVPARGVPSHILRQLVERKWRLPRSAGRLVDWQVRRGADYIRAHLAENISLQQLADLLHLSRFHFPTAFRMATGHTPLQWRTAQRVAGTVNLSQLNWPM